MGNALVWQGGADPFFEGKKNQIPMDRGISYGILSTILVLSFFGFGCSDITSDRNECTSQLVGLSICLGYAQGQAKVPTKACCDGLKQVIVKSKKCLCILIKDSKDPQLGITINTTLALTLPAACNTPTSIPECIDLLHLVPNSTEAQIFMQPGVTPSPTPNSNGNITTKSASEDTSSGRRISGKKRWWGLEIASGLWISCVVSMLIMGS